VEQEIAQPPTDLGQGLHTLLFVNSRGKQAVPLHGKWPPCFNYQLPGKVSRGEKLMETAKQALSRGPPCSPSSGLQRAEYAFTAEPWGVSADTHSQHGREGERGLHPAQQTFPTHPPSCLVPAKARRSPWVLSHHATLGRKHPSDAEDDRNGLVGLWRCCGYVTDSVVGQQRCPWVAEGSEHMVGLGLCLPRDGHCSTAGRHILTMLLF